MASAYPGGRHVILEALRLKNIPEESLNICVKSITDSTLSQYNTGLKLWWEFCTNFNINPYNISAPTALQFLTTHFNKGATYGTLNSYRSAIAQISGPELGQDPGIKRFFRGVHSLRPALPKYTHTWDPSVVLNYIKELNNRDLNLEFLTKKLCILLALTTAQRVQTLFNIEICNIRNNGTAIEIDISKRIKTSGKNKFQPTLVLPFFHHDINICPATTLLDYVDRTETLRGDTKHLFITYRKPYHKASTQTISRWLKSMLDKCGVDTEQFTAHSTRHAATSAAARKGVNIDRIRLAAGWTESSSTFANFYNRPLIQKNIFAKKILEST